LDLGAFPQIASVAGHAVATCTKRRGSDSLRIEKKEYPANHVTADSRQSQQELRIMNAVTKEPGDTGCGRSMAGPTDCRDHPFGVIRLGEVCEEQGHAPYHKKSLPSRSFEIDLCHSIRLPCVCGGDNFNS
jgi:hypothetical protein